MKLKQFKSILSLKTQMLLYFILVTLIPISIISSYYYYNSIFMEKKNTGESNYKVISHIMENIDRQVEQANNLSDWAYLESTIATLLKRPAAEKNKFDLVNKQAIDNIALQFQYVPITKYIQSLFILGDNGVDIRYGREASLIDPEDFIQSDWYMKGKVVADKVFWGKLTKNYTDISAEKYVIPQFRVLKNLDNGRVLGYSVMLYNQKFFFDSYKEVLLNKGEAVYLTDEGGNVISTNQPLEIESNISDRPYFQKVTQNPEQSYFEETLEDKIHLVTYKKSSKTGWILMEIVPLTQIQKQKNFMEKTTLVLIAGVILMCIFLSIFLSDNLTRPIKTLVWQVNEIAQGNFDQQAGLNISNEIGILSRSISKMKEDINQLIQDSIRKEKEKRTLEIRMLQSQINPHFLYNTLNSIKLMASLQGAKGIERATGALGRVLKAALSGVNEKIHLQEEISILEDYISIQNIRYNGSVRYSKNIEDESLLRCKVIKFILQPIVENTIMHGIAPKDEMGEVTLSVYQEEDKLMIEVLDNGVGMSLEKMKAIEEEMNVPDRVHRDKGIGMRNINQRIKLVYGEEYGLSLESKEEEYTKVILTLPVELDESDLQVR